MGKHAEVGGAERSGETDSAADKTRYPQVMLGRQYPSTVTVLITYVIASVVWVIGGDALLLTLSTDPGSVAQLQTYKGLGFVVLSVLLLLWFGRSRDRAVIDWQANEVALQESNRRYRALFESGIPPMLLFDADTGMVVDANPAALDFYGYGLEGITRLHAQELSAMNVRQNVSLLDMAREGSRKSFEMKHLLSDGSVRDVMCQAGPLSVNGKRHVYSVVYDITESKAIHEELARMASKQRVLAELGQHALQAVELPELMSMAVDSVAEVLGVDLVHILQLEPSHRHVTLWAWHGWESDADAAMLRLPVGEGSVLEEIVRTGEPATVTDHAADDRFKVQEFTVREGITSSMGVLIAYEADKYGVLTVHARERREFGSADGAFLQSVANVLAAAVRQNYTAWEVARAHHKLVLAYDETIEGWARTLDMRDQETEGHSRRVTDLAVALGGSLGLGAADIQRLRRGALLHDIGKMAVPDSILRKPGPLTGDEWRVMRQHTVLGWELLSGIEFLRDAAEVPHAHHEKWDGSGYPRGLSGEQIPLAARVFAVVDVYDALTSDRPYRRAWTEEQALSHIARESGSHFDPVVVDAFLELKRTHA